MRELRISALHVALVDDADFETVSLFNWYAHKGKRTVYARADVYEGGKKRRVFMHRMLLGFPTGGVDHRDHNGLNNQRGNLRPATTKQNAANGRSRGGSSKFKGVTWDAKRAKWSAQITVDGVNHNLGRFAAEGDAAAAYDRRASTVEPAYRLLNLA